MKRLILCADDYALSPGVSRAIRELVLAGRLNATSVMSAGPDLQAEAAALLGLGRPGLQIGLHVTLTGGLAPLTAPRLRRFFGLTGLMLRCFTGMVDKTALSAEIGAQFAAFDRAFGRPPDFIDGHQHVHLLPVVRSLVLDAARRHAPGAWLRQCRDAGEGLKGRIISGLSGGLIADAKTAGFVTNPAFSGAYEFGRATDFAEIFPRFLADLPDGGLVMVHPGYVDDALRRVDPVHEPREMELAYLAGDRFPQALGAAGFVLG
ncbi:ChbG/HpnK family deacetylase [Phreatobacter stygius]|uniref:ChbG/HpnK family deacetylase n=1 Tax=Phreatobacter stygius TaxID=1940610 RepID=A0A4D7AX18_9HYPH|nr:ChbG/HpnK family deacetylase [Phreatobacter stygius]QCI65719.1 ChbG/HpnK family deacetylase [Phreatobacter stygius]